ncbi:hypothetical protein [Bacillus atrophaeus]|uniref:hypothetical protein n=1 Tax=Bacillus atrophaeus TaxID=1452 RepID=UPI002281241D|nr:hypothetical protein [Bacillus atrophaeus]MCY8986330.1 hypothetical protein [Bacillus atrophaeus]
MMKKLMMVMFVSVLAVTGAFCFGGTDKAKATNAGCKSFIFPSGVGNATSYVCASDNNYSVNGTVQMGRVGTWETVAYTKLYLQRKVDGKWKTIDTAKGKASTSSKLNRTFSNIAKKKASMRIKAVMYSNSNYTGKLKTAYSNTWKR